MNSKTVTFLGGMLRKISVVLFLLVFAIASISFAATIQLPQTGQTKCYDTAGTEILCAGTGQDGEILAGVTWPEQRFTLGTGAESDCMTDNLSGLMWPKNGNIAGLMSWNSAIDYANNLTLCGYSDWRLPNINELESLVNADQTNTTTWLNYQGFINVLSNYYWSSTTNVGSTDFALVVSVWDGAMVGYYNKSSNFYFWPVHSKSSGVIQLPKTGQTVSYATGDDGDWQQKGVGVVWPNPRFNNNENGTVIDNLTGLIWLKDTNCFGIKTWNQALDSVNNLSEGQCGLTDGSNPSDWRLPNRNELRSLIDYSTYNPALPTGYPFTNVQYAYWSSTTAVADGTALAGIIDTRNGYVDISYKFNYAIYVWPVRDAQVTPPPPAIWDVPYLTQLDYSNNMRESACGPTSITMLLMYYYPNSQIDMPEVYHSGTQGYRYVNGPAYYYRNVSFACGVTGCDSGLSIVDPRYRNRYVGTYSGMNVNSMRNYLTNVWEIQTTKLTTIDDVYREIQSAPLLGHVFALGNRNYGHYLVIRGIDNNGTPDDRKDDYIIVNDPYKWNKDYNGDGYRISYKDFFVGSKGKVRWFRDAFKLTPIDSYNQRMFTVVVDTGNNDFEGNATANMFQLDDPAVKTAKGDFVWRFKYGGGVDSYFPIEGGHSASWIPNLNQAGTYQVSVHFKAGGGDVTYTVYDINHNALENVTINQSITSTTATCDLITGWCNATIAEKVYLDNGSYVIAYNITAKSNVDTIKFKYLF